ncbi:MAG TPA: hypothetical protein VFF86_04155 [Candidatus Methylomirabilis sp.]|nr:hypothetical protein [Candidatus Methylomirabilis sp.]
MVVRYFSPAFRVWYAAGLLQRKGVDAWRCFIRASAAHEQSDMTVRTGSVGRPVPFSLSLALIHAEVGKNSDRPPVKATTRG